MFSWKLTKINKHEKNKYVTKQTTRSKSATEFHFFGNVFFTLNYLDWYCSTLHPSINHPLIHPSIINPSIHLLYFLVERFLNSNHLFLLLTEDSVLWPVLEMFPWVEAEYKIGEAKIFSIKSRFHFFSFMWEVWRLPVMTVIELSKFGHLYREVWGV